MTDLLVLPPGDWRAVQRVYGLDRASDVVSVSVRRGGLDKTQLCVTGRGAAQLLALLTKLGSDPRPIAFRLGRLREYPVARLKLEIAHERANWVATPTHYLKVTRDSRARIAGGALYWNYSTRPSAIELARLVASYLDEMGQESVIAYFLRDSEDLLRVHGVGEDDIVSADELLRKQRKRKSLDEEDDLIFEDAKDDEEFAADLDEETDGEEADHAEGAEEDRVPSGTGASGRHLHAVDPFKERTEDSSGHARKPPPDPGVYVNPADVSFGSPVPGREGPAEPRRSGGRDGRQAVSSGLRTSSFRVSNPETESRAVELVIRYATEVLGARVKDVQEDHKGWDLEFHFPDGTWEAVEVKGSASQGRFVITRNELRQARSYDNYRLYFVTNLEKGQDPRMIRFFDVGSIDEDALGAVAWEVDWSSLGHDVIPLSVSARKKAE